MDVTPRGMTTDVNRLKPNAVVPIDLTEGGMTTDASLCLNAALSLIEVTEGEMTRCLVPSALVVIVKPSDNSVGLLLGGSHESSSHAKRPRQIVWKQKTLFSAGALSVLYADLRLVYADFVERIIHFHTHDTIFMGYFHILI